jgi:putative acetyltransferase
MEPLRRATLSDMPAVAGLHRLAFFHAMPHMPVLHTPEEDLAYYEGSVFPKSEIWVIEKSGMIAGFIAYRAERVDHLYVHPSYHGQGLGSTLLGVAKCSADSLRLWTFQCNSKARRFYERHGFFIEEGTDGAGNEERQPDVLYAWVRPASFDGV